MGRCTKLEKERRLQKVFELVLKGYRREQIYKIVTDKKMMASFGGAWTFTIGHLDCYLKEVKEMFKEYARYESIVEFGKAYTRLQELFANAKTTKDKLAVLKEMNEVLGLKEIKINLGGQINTVDHITVEIVKSQTGNGEEKEEKDERDKV